MAHNVEEIRNGLMHRSLRRRPAPGFRSNKCRHGLPTTMVEFQLAMTHVLEGHRQELVELCRRYRVRRLDVFGSAARLTSTRVERRRPLVEFEDMPHADRADAYLGFLTAAEALLRTSGSTWLRWRSANPYLRRESRNPENSSMPRDPRAWLADIVAACELLIEFPEAKRSPTTPAMPLAVGSGASVEIVGEALRVALQHQPELAANMTDVRAIIAFRNQLTHAYSAVDHATAGVSWNGECRSSGPK